MKRIIILSQARVWVEGSKNFLTVEELLAQPPQKDTLLIGIVPAEVGRVLATPRTLDGAMAQQYPGENSFSTLPIDTNVHQVYAAPDALLGKLRKLSKDVRIVPYPAAVMAAVTKQRRQLSLIERTQVFLSARQSEAAAEEEGKREVLAIDSVGDDEYLMTAIRDREVLGVRYAQGEVVSEVQRTLASARMDAPVLMCTDEQLSLELKAQGFEAELLDVQPFIGVETLRKVEDVRFLNQFEVAQKRQAQSRRTALLLNGMALALFVVVAGVWLLLSARAEATNRRRAQLEAAKQEQLAALGALYADRYGSIARGRSLQIRNEVFDLSTVLPPQVVMLNVKKDAAGTVALVERRPQAAPFNTDDLRAALRASSYFSTAEITEQYDGHLIRYVLKVVPRVAPLED
jgi:hypothetical protein